MSNIIGRFVEIGGIIVVKIQETKGRYFITIPREIIRLKGWEKGTNLAVIESNNEIVLKQTN